MRVDRLSRSCSDIARDTAPIFAEEAHCLDEALVLFLGPVAVTLSPNQVDLLLILLSLLLLSEEKTGSCLVLGFAIAPPQQLLNVRAVLICRGCLPLALQLRLLERHDYFILIAIVNCHGD